MAKSKHKIARQAENEKKRRQTKIIIAVGSLVVVATVVVFLVLFYQSRQSSSRVFSDGYQIVNLRDDGTFSARLFHRTINGTYTEIPENRTSTIIFTHDGAFAYSRLTNNVLILPNEWDDFHCHNMRLLLRD